MKTILDAINERLAEKNRQRAEAQRRQEEWNRQIVTLEKLAEVEISALLEERFSIALSGHGFSPIATGVVDFDTLPRFFEYTIRFENTNGYDSYIRPSFCFELVDPEQNIFKLYGRWDDLRFETLFTKSVYKDAVKIVTSDFVDALTFALYGVEEPKEKVILYVNSAPVLLPV